MKNIILSIGTSIGWVFSLFFGTIDELLRVLIVFVIIDYITGLMKAIINKKVSSAIGFKGLVSKMLIFILVGIANTLDTYIFKQEYLLRTVVIFFYLSNEGISILENIAYIGLPIPNKLKEVLTQLNNQKE